MWAVAKAFAIDNENRATEEIHQPVMFTIFQSRLLSFGNIAFLVVGPDGSGCVHAPHLSPTNPQRDGGS